MPKFFTPLDQTFSALADPTRRAVLMRLAEGPASVTHLAEPFDMALPSFVQHLRVLEDGGLIVTEKTGRTRVCRINPAAFGQVEDWMAAQRRKWEAQTDRLQAFLEGGHDLADGPRPSPNPERKPGNERT
jgi:DNA-binding transcriptional ArsR family regulator